MDRASGSLSSYFSDLFIAIVSCLEAIKIDSDAKWNRESKSDALTHLISLSQFSFIVALETTHTVLSYTRGLSVKLQGTWI